MSEAEPEFERQLFVDKFAANQHRVFSFVVSLSPGWTDAEDIFQRVSIVLWQKWGDYDHSREFLAWAFGIARLEVLKYLSENNRRKELLGGDAMKAIQERTSEAQEEIDERMQALQHCLARLPRKQRSLIDRCYCGVETIKTIAREIGLTSDALYWRLKRIREKLHQCVDRSVAAEN